LNSKYRQHAEDYNNIIALQSYGRWSIHKISRAEIYLILRPASHRGYYLTNKLCTYLFDLASDFTSFYEHCPVLKAESEDMRLSRLMLCDATARTIAQGLALLGIESPEQM
jgi:hypothetical protein